MSLSDNVNKSIIRCLFDAVLSDGGDGGGIWVVQDEQEDMSALLRVIEDINHKEYHDWWTITTGPAGIIGVHNQEYWQITKEMGEGRPPVDTIVIEF